MKQKRRAQRIVELEAEYRRTEAALAQALAEHERSFAALWSEVSDEKDSPTASPLASLFTVQ